MVVREAELRDTIAPLQRLRVQAGYQDSSRHFGCSRRRRSRSWCSRATVYVNVPDRKVADGVVEYTRHAVTLMPRGRERRLQLVYEAGVVAVGGTMRLEPGHDASAATEFGAAAKMRWRF